NILVTDETDKPRILLGNFKDISLFFLITHFLLPPKVDFEHGTYGCRGYDIGVFHLQWGVEPQDYDRFSMPDDSVMINFIRLYIEGCDHICPGYSCKAENSVEAILREAKLYMIVYFFFWTIFNLHQ